MTQRYQYEFRVKYEGKLQPGDYYTVGENGEKTLVFPGDVVDTLKSGKNVFVSVGYGKCRELSLRTAK